MTTLLHNQDLSTVVTLYRHARILVEIKLGWKIGQERRDGSLVEFIENSQFCTLSLR